MAAALESPEVYGYTFGGIDEEAAEVLRSDDAVLREAFNLRQGPLELADPAARDRAMEQRTELLDVLLRLHRVGHRQNAGYARRPLTSTEVQVAMSALNRLRLTVQLPMEEIALYCERKAIEDGEGAIHSIDPLQLRHILSAHRRTSRERLGEDVIAALKSAATSGRKDAIAAWFKAARSRPLVPADLGQISRCVLLELSRTGAAGLASLAQEIAMHDLRAYSELGWESARSFLSLVARLQPSQCAVLDVYHSRSELEEAVATYRWLDEVEVTKAWQAKLEKFQEKTLEDTRRAVVAAGERAQQVRAVEPAVAVVRSAPRRANLFLRALGWNSSSTTA
jgi:hypothetical protein